MQEAKAAAKAERKRRNEEIHSRPAQIRAQSGPSLGSNTSAATSSLPSAPSAAVTTNSAAVTTTTAHQAASGTTERRKPVSRTEAQKKVPLFLHLKQVEREGSLTKKVSFVAQMRGDVTGVHPSVVTLGLRYAEGVIRGADARAVGMFQAFGDVVRDFSTPEREPFSRVLTKHLSLQFDFLTSCRPHSITMGNALNHVKQAVSRIPWDKDEDDAKRYVQSVLDEFVRTSVIAASEEIAAAGAKHIAEGDIILTYARSSVVEKVLLLAHKMGKAFKVIVIGSRPSNEGVELLKRLSRIGIKCGFAPLAALSYVLQGSVTKVFLGAGALLSNGAVLARAGTAMVAAMAHMQRIPVLVFAESYKFSEKVLLDSVVFNELGDPEDLLISASKPGGGGMVTTEPLDDWRDVPSLKLLNLVFDVTQSEYVDMVVTELGNLPPSSVPVIIRERKDLKSF